MIYIPWPRGPAASARAGGPAGRAHARPGVRAPGGPGLGIGGPLSGRSGSRRLERVAVLGGSGGDFLAQAAGAGAQMYITGEAGHHAGQQAADLGICLLLLGHYETENPVVKPWARRLARMLAAQKFSCQVKPCTGNNNPWRALND